ncbi:MAG: hypothetical protein KAS97_07795 [Candidatus Aminicenantes bacterium]|nr:hypothetical protein [Candidatus Aminicenantes bacterium]
MKRFFIVLSFLLSTIINMNLSGQNFDYRYYESPAVSWNGITMHDSRQLSMGGISLAADGHSMQIANPAFFSDKKGVEIGFSHNYLLYQSFQYWGINEGVRRYQDPFSERKIFHSSIAIRLGFNDWSLTTGWYRSALNDFPDFTLRSEYDHDQFQYFKGTFSGFDEIYFVSFGITLSSKLTAGIKIEYKRGTRNTQIENFSSLYFFLDGYWQLKDKRSVYSESNISGTFIPELGFIFNINSRLKAGLTIKYPIRGKVDREIIRSLSNSDGLNIYDNYLYTDDHYDVPVLSAGILYDAEEVKIFRSSGKLIVGAELEFRKWSDYRYIFYGEEHAREVVDTFKFSAGAEYVKKLKKFDLLFRIGLGLDRQPVVDPGTVLKIISTGLGIKYKGVSTGIGISYIHGSTGGSNQGHLLVCTSLSKIL